MTAPAIPFGGRAVLENVAAQRSPWHGWEGGHAARTPEGQDAYQERARAISACRAKGLLTEENQLTDDGHKALAWIAEAVRG